MLRPPHQRRQNVTSLADHTEPGLSSTLLPAPQSETDGEEEIIVITLAPRLERHIASGDVGSAAVVLEFVHQSVSILGAFGDPDLPLLKSGYSREDQDRALAHSSSRPSD